MSFNNFVDCRSPQQSQHRFQIMEKMFDGLSHSSLFQFLPNIRKIECLPTLRLYVSALIPNNLKRNVILILINFAQQSSAFCLLFLPIQNQKTCRKDYNQQHLKQYYSLPDSMYFINFHFIVSFRFSYQLCFLICIVMYNLLEYKLYMWKNH